MRPIATDGVVWSVCMSVCLLDTFVSPVKMTELIVWKLTEVGPRNHVLHGVNISKVKGQFWGLPVH